MTEIGREHVKRSGSVVGLVDRCSDTARGVESKTIQKYKRHKAVGDERDEELQGSLCRTMEACVVRVLEFMPPEHFYDIMSYFQEPEHILTIFRLSIACRQFAGWLDESIWHDRKETARENIAQRLQNLCQGCGSYSPSLYFHPFIRDAWTCSACQSNHPYYQLIKHRDAMTVHPRGCVLYLLSDVKAAAKAKREAKITHLEADRLNIKTVARSQAVVRDQEGRRHDYDKLLREGLDQFGLRMSHVGLYTCVSRTEQSAIRKFGYEKLQEFVKDRVKHHQLHKHTDYNQAVEIATAQQADITRFPYELRLQKARVLKVLALGALKAAPSTEDICACGVPRGVIKLDTEG
ncbi:hypothetical protein G7K_2842-t1 [Saitoella complicata NRRL Y-17804]|uniref:Uncharacterized protein n=1 Tax=Saitoella complicata (strain BCRC 22490 / CBS 7301 / JCM 7358 / NBRC 10748 / NRRL Y-17804) TaxID=698492 RepID=A0A0E9NFM8_SAICN|nr:hypothetical protein G7K_2842-t1 [Saitoella complicata NRRL Y-17804]